MLNINQTSQALVVIEQAKRILCLCHQNPDGDAIGSLLGLSRLLTAKFPSTSVLTLCRDPAPLSLIFLKGASHIQSVFSPQAGDLIIILDSAEAKLTGYLEAFPDIFTPDTATARGFSTMKIDHHPEGSSYCHLNLVDTEAASSCEVVVDLADELNIPIDPASATALLTGMYTDTGSMMHSNTSGRVYKTAARLLRAGADHELIMKHVFRTSKISTLRLWGRVLEKISLSQDGAAISAVTAGDFRATNADFSELTGAIDYVNSIPGMKFSLILSERNGVVKGSLRTLQDDVDVAAMARKFSGGGHTKAAGFSIPGTLESETRWKVVPNP